jgi:CRP/FNR family cyclic AMP-dependent transcriptional regulator
VVSAGDGSAALLRRLAMLRGCSDDEVAALARLVEPVEVEAGHVLVQEGATDRFAFLVVDGWASVRRNGRSIFSLGAGQFVGEMANLNGRPRSATVVAATPMTLLVVAPEHFGAFTAHPAVALRLTESLSARVRMGTDRS